VIHHASPTTVVVFALFVLATLGLSFWLGRRAKSAEGYFAAHGSVHWFVNGIAFAGDYLSAASFLGICGMIAFFGYDGFLYSIGYLAGWIVALFVIAEPLKARGRFTFADALDSQFRSRGVRLAAAASTLVVSLFYLIPQMVGAGVLIQPLLGFSHATGVLIVGAVVILIVTTAGMVSTTYVQFLKGSLLIVFSTAITFQILSRGLVAAPEGGLDAPSPFLVRGPFSDAEIVRKTAPGARDAGGVYLPADGAWKGKPYVRKRADDGVVTVWRIEATKGADRSRLVETQTVFEPAGGGAKLVNGKPQGEFDLAPVGHVRRLPDGKSQTGPLGPLEFLATVQASEIVLWGSEKIAEPEGATTIYYRKPTPGGEVLRPGNHPTFKGVRSENLGDKANFLSLMLALFCGTASLPHILIRYYTVKDAVSVRKSTIVGIASIGFFYILTLFLGLGAMTSGALDVTNSNMAAPLLARSIGEFMFAAISAIAFTTVLGTVCGLIVAASGAVAHDLLEGVLRLPMTDRLKVLAGKATAIAIGVVAIGLGILFQKMNVNYLVGWAFSIAASANLPALVMLLFWRRTTKEGVIAGIWVGMLASLGWILVSGDTFKDVYGLPAERAWVPFTQPGLVTIPLGFLTLVVVSLLTGRRTEPRF
jgi:cation/acetate symporter